MLLFKSCPRCNGDMHTNRDMYGEYKECLNCGHMEDIERSDDLLSLRGQRTKKKAA